MPTDDADLDDVIWRAPVPMHSVGQDGKLCRVSDEWVAMPGHARTEPGAGTTVRLFLARALAG